MSAPRLKPKPAVSGAPAASETAESYLVRRHLRVGWWSLGVFLTLGIVLESFHGFKVGWYLSAANSTRRLMFTLAHAHGTLLGLVHIAFATTVPRLPRWDPRPRALAANCLVGAGLLIPIGFFWGGVFVYGGDPGLGIVLVPVGALLLLVAVFLTARAGSGCR